MLSSLSRWLPGNSFVTSDVPQLRLLHAVAKSRAANR
jgi:hypothetical protein